MEETLNTPTGKGHAVCNARLLFLALNCVRQVLREIMFFGTDFGAAARRSENEAIPSDHQIRCPAGFSAELPGQRQEGKADSTKAGADGL